MDLWYIDGFAGSGDREAEREIGGIFEGRPLETIVETLDGSARRALKVDPPFNHHIFIERDPERAEALRQVKIDFPQADIQVLAGEANHEILQLVGRPPWTRAAASNSRAVIFLDPFAMQVDWATLQAIAHTKAMDVWYLFNVSAIIRQLALDIAGVGNKADMLDRVLSSRWRELYAIPPEEAPAQAGLFDNPGTPLPRSARRMISKAQIDGWFKKLLEEEFAYVSDPLPIVTPHAGHQFSLFLGVANPDPKATNLAKDFAGYVTRKFAPAALASRRKSGR